MNLPVIDLAATPPTELLEVFARHGAVLLDDPLLPVATREQALRDAHAFFALPQADKDVLSIANSAHFRGYSTMHNERDWREQIHFGRELAALAPPPAYHRLQGPNLWPRDQQWSARMQAYLAAVEQVGTRLLHKLATALRLDAALWLGPDPYLLMKCIAYHPQVHGAPPRQGVAAHLDFSLVTLTLQDDVGGLEVRDPAGHWLPVPTQRRAWLVNLGELLQYATGNRLIATPHRVVNPSAQRTRVSIPVFVNPSLATTLRAHPEPLPLPPAVGAHVHAVLPGGARTPALQFGAAEWQRKGENRWCAQCQAGQM